MKNSLSAPVEIVNSILLTTQNLKSSNQDRLDIEPKYKKLAPFESFTADKNKETIFIKSDFFDQKVNVTLIQAAGNISTQQNITGSTTPRDSSLQNSFMRGGAIPKSRQQQSRDSSRDNFHVRNQSSLEGSSPKFQNKKADLGAGGLNRNASNQRVSAESQLEQELLEKESIIQELNQQLRQQENETQNAVSLYKQEQAKRKDLEERLENSGQSNQNEELLQKFRYLLREREPNLEQLMDLTLKKERDHQERKDAKVLEILKIKDKQIEELQQRVVSQESDYGKLASVFQEQKSQIRQLESKLRQQLSNQSEIESELVSYKYKLESFEKGSEYKRLLELDDKLKQAQEQLEIQQQDIYKYHQELQEKSQLDQFYEEAMQRYKDQASEKELYIQQLKQEHSQEKELRIRLEEQTKTLRLQINQMSEDTYQERGQQTQKLKQERDMLERISRLEQDKEELRSYIEEKQKEKESDNELLEEILDRLMILRDGNNSGVQSFGVSRQGRRKDKSVAQIIEDKVEDIARLLKEMEEGNIELNQQVKKLQERLNSREEELQSIIEENEQLGNQLNKKRKTKVKSTQTSIEQEDMEIYEDSRDRFIQIESENDKLKKLFNDQQKKLQNLEYELEGKNQEMMMIMRSNSLSQANQSVGMKQSSVIMGTESQANQYQSEEIVSRLNSKITQLKMNEERLLEELKELRSLQQNSVISFNKSSKDTNHTAGTGYNTNQQQTIALEERISEYEIIVLDQRQQLINLSDENLHLKHQLNEAERKYDQETQEMRLRLKNLQELKDKHEQINQQILSSQESGYFNSQKSTAVETERFRQIAQQLELNNMQLKHHNDELKNSLKAFQDENKELKNDLLRQEQIVNRLKQEIKVVKVGLSGSDDKDNRLTSKVIEQRNKIKYLQGLLIRAKQDFDTLKSQNSHHKSSNLLTITNSSDQNSSHEKLRKEHQQALMLLIDLKEEYSNKLMLFTDKYETQRSALTQENLSLQRKLEHLQTQLSYMEKKEMRLFGQLEEAKSLHSQETHEKETRTRELEDLLFKKEELINDLEREVKLKEKTLQERQDQISVLIGTLENEHSSDETRQKLLNQSAEICSIKAIQAQNERRMNEMLHEKKKQELMLVKITKQLESERAKSTELKEAIKKLEKDNENFERQIEDLKVSMEDKERQVQEGKFQCERQEFQVKLKDQTIGQMREQVSRQEKAFKEEVERIRKEFNDKINQQQQQKNSQVSETNSRNSLQFKTALQQLHICVADYLNNLKPNSDNQNSLIKEFEKALSVASQTIEKLQSELDKQYLNQAYFAQDLQAQALNKTLISRQEQQQIKLQKLTLLYLQREDERSSLAKQQDFQLNKITKEQDSKIVYLGKQVDELEQENASLRQQLEQLKDQKEELEQNLILFNSETENKRQAMERKAELAVDERFKSKHEQIKSYFDSNITRILLNTQSSTNDKILELGREIVALKLQQQKLQDTIFVQQSENQALELNLTHYKEQYSILEQSIRDQNLKYNQLSSRLQSQDLQVKIEIEKKKQEFLNLEKELLKTRDQLEIKTREVIHLQTDKINNNSTQQYNTKSNDSQSIIDQFAMKEAQIQTLQAQIQDLQDHLVDTRAQNIHELEDLRVQYDLELTEARRHLIKEKESLEKRYMPGYAPGDLMESNQELQNRIIELKGALDRIMQENAILRKKFESEKLSNESQRGELQAYKQALSELESTMVDISNQQSQSQQQQQKSIIKMSNQPSRDENSQTRKKGLKTKTQKKVSSSLHFNKDQNNAGSSAYDSDYQYSQSKISTTPLGHNDSSSLNVSALTQVNMISGGGSIPQTNRISGQKQFIFNPPLIVRALIQSKINETLFKRKYEDLINQEVDLRQQFKEQSLKFLQSSLKQDNDIENDQIRRRLIQLEVENEELKIKGAQSRLENLQQQQQQTININSRVQEYDQYPMQDYNTMQEALLVLINQVADSQQSQQNDNSTIEEAQRIVIKSLLTKIRDSSSITYIPAEQQDRKLWYLELLESQVHASEQVVQDLQSFIKKLQIDISGNLQSAAQIKASSMDLAQNTKKTSDEVRTLKNIIGLIKHDLTKNNPPSTQTQANIHSKTINPFSGDRTLYTGGQDDLHYQIDQIQNQLTLSERVKKTLETELLQLKLNHAQELNQMTQRLTQATDQRNSLLQTNEELHDKVQHLQQSLDKLKHELIKMTSESAQQEQALIDKEKDRQLTQQNKSATSKQLQKLQQDMHEWRKQSEENMRNKERQVQELQQAMETMKNERDRLKSECQMLRREQKERKQGINEDIKKLENENKQLIDRLNSEINERKKEIEYWITERATMREMIDQLESEKVDFAIHDPTSKISPDTAAKQDHALKKKLTKKIKERDLDLRNKEKQVQELRDELTKVKLLTTQLEAKLRDISSKNMESEERMKYYQQKLKEVELERDLVLAEKNNALVTNDISAQQIQSELNSLRECFAKLKVERDNLLFEMESIQQREQEQRSIVDRLNDELKNMERNLRDKDVGSEQVHHLEHKNQTLIADIKFLKQENERLKDRVKEQDQNLLQMEQRMHQEQLKQQEIGFQYEEQKRIQVDLKQVIKGKEQMISDLQGQLLIVESQKLKDIEGLRNKLDEVKEANAQIISLYENQIQDLRQKFINDKKRSDQQVDQMISLAQREAVIKNLKKELTQGKAQLAKVKAKNKELKNIIGNQENTQPTRQVPISHKRLSTSKSLIVNEDYSAIDKSIIKLAQALSTDESGGYRDLLDQLQKCNTVMNQYLELKADLEKSNKWNMVISQQLQDTQEQNQELQAEIEQLQKVNLKESKFQKQSQMNNELTSKYKQDVKLLQSEIESMKQEWLSPSDNKQLQEKLKDYQSQIKSLKDEILRKREVISQLKQQRGQTEVEANQILADMEGLKDDNLKLQKLIRENNKNMAMVKELKGTNDYLKNQERRLKEEIISLNDKLKQTRIDLSRKEQLAKEYKDKLDYIQDEISSKDKFQEMERLKEINKKLKLETEIKDNQVKALKQRLEHSEEELEQLRTLSQSQATNTQSEQQIRLTKNKIKKYEAYLRKSLEAIRKIGKELSQSSSRATHHKRSSQMKNNKSNDNPMMLSEFEKDYYKDSVNILGVSIDELEEFMNPSLNLSNAENQNFIARLDKVVDIPESLNQDIDQICQYCVKLIKDINPDISFK